MPARVAIRYRYYLSSASLKAQPSVPDRWRRVPAADIEALVIRSVREHIQLSQRTIDDRSLVNTHVARVDVQSHQLVIKLVPQPAAKSSERSRRWRPSCATGRRPCQRGAGRLSCPRGPTGSMPAQYARRSARP